MRQPHYNYDKEADVLYISFGRSKNATYVELDEHLILRLDKGEEPNKSPRAIGLTVLYPAFFRKAGHTLTISPTRLKKLRPELRAAVMEVLLKPPLSDLLETQLTVQPEILASASSAPA